MYKICIFLVCCFAWVSATNAATRQSNATQTSAYNYNYMYPFMNNQMRNELNPGTSIELNSNPISSVVRTSTLPQPARRVVARPGTNSTTARAAGTSRTQTTSPSATTNNTNTRRRVVARSTTTTQGAPARRRVVARSSRGDASFLGRAAANAANMPESTNTTVSSARCLADYIECMNRYCVREETEYNRCYCSAKLAQIDSKYQPAIEKLVRQIITMRNKNPWSDAEMNEYWMSVVGQYTTENSWEKIDEALNIDWASTESRVRGQQAFATGHEYCAQHLRGCYYMASNMRDAYRSEISRDCAKYESKLQTIKNLAESVLEANQ